MEHTQENILLRLEAAIATWTNQVTGAERELAAQLTQARNELQDFLRKVGTVRSKGDSEVERLKQTLAQYEQTVKADAERISELEHAVAQLRTQAEHMTAAEQDLSRELNAARTELGSAREQIAAARNVQTTLNEMESAVKEHRSRADKVVDELDQALKEKLDADGRVEALRMELDAAYRQIAEARSVAEDAEKLRAAAAAEREGADQLARELSNLRADKEEADKEIAKLRADIELLRVANASLTRPAQKTPDPAQPVAAEKRKPAKPPKKEKEQEGLVIRALDTSGKKRKIGDILVESGIITEDQLSSALMEQEIMPQRRLGTILVESGFVKEEVIAQVLASQARIPFIRLSAETIDPKAPALITGRMASHHMCIPIRATSDRVVVAMANPMDLIAQEDVQLASKLQVDPVAATQSDIMSAIEQHYKAE